MTFPLPRRFCAPGLARALTRLGLVILLVTALGPVPAARADGGSHPPTGVTFGETQVVVETWRGRTKLRVLFARTRPQITQGLMYRRTLKPWDGMLFDLGRDQPGNFWMRNTHIPLDIIFIRRDGTVDSVGRGVPLSLKPVLSKGPIRGVLEIRAGRAKDLAIQPGSVIRHPMFGNARR